MRSLYINTCYHVKLNTQQMKCKVLNLEMANAKDNETPNFDNLSASIILPLTILLIYCSYVIHIHS